MLPSGKDCKADAQAREHRPEGRTLALRYVYASSWFRK
jgi:hypothetical protein